MVTRDVSKVVFEIFADSFDSRDFWLGLIAYGLPAGAAGVFFISVAVYCDLKCLFTRRDADEEFDRLSERLFGNI